MFLDACAIIYLLETNDEKSDKVRRLVNDYLVTKEHCIFVSSLSILECLAFPKKMGDKRLIAEYEVFFATKNVEIIDMSREVVYLAVELRAKYNLRSPDALQLACAFSRQLSFMTADKDLFKVEEIEIIKL